LFWASVEHEFAQLPRDRLILPPLGGCGPQAIDRYTGPEPSGDPQPWNRAIVRPPGPRRLKWLDVASNPPKLRGIRRPHEPKSFEPAFKHLQLLRGHAGDGADCITPRPSFMPQATEKAQNGGDQQLAANEFSIPQDAIASLLHRLVRRCLHFIAAGMLSRVP